MKALKYIFFLLLITIIALALYIAVQPNDYEVTRTRTIKAPAAVIYDHVNDYKNWSSWSSWVENNPNMKITLPENTSGVGGSYSWEDADGVGTMKTVEVNPNSAIEQEMQINDYPKSEVSWKFSSNEDGSTDVTWTISAKICLSILRHIQHLWGTWKNKLALNMSVA
ncbi:SRPBCC family protein [Lacinutrix neustonica]|uniref:SRPBCC family protein n=1 Tax=Lacinutrix neustonica TaxID=2980107 RepID=A0A9E8MVI7_9FLAO|nr:SRPBCC family protein [Lacinutrix neustonica]WAC01831.1 SRPBCC family protein [Lacinutrix neustonica]